ncbi:hypothetical protein BDK51DRAFT_52132 [Blyttiomyces helicus]|uniref:Uncharacterized protein n=1 Tax=Blyttiomyces helicus TaxID=388810 RepID=A0A4P9VXX4_9FUNG|nr:hypothetical protein BDK51DRAFT_52132 [Blyttiomyces helicus]|eukprot:RKO84611.1 hypothetical protein BDK51DRAFT_52132 [Blyttiomyces helicus]
MDDNDDDLYDFFGGPGSGASATSSMQHLLPTASALSHADLDLFPVQLSGLTGGDTEVPVEAGANPPDSQSHDILGSTATDWEADTGNGTESDPHHLTDHDRSNSPGEIAHSRADHVSDVEQEYSDFEDVEDIVGDAAPAVDQVDDGGFGLDEDDFPVQLAGSEDVREEPHAVFPAIDATGWAPPRMERSTALSSHAPSPLPLSHAPSPPLSSHASSPPSSSHTPSPPSSSHAPSPPSSSHALSPPSRRSFLRGSPGGGRSAASSVRGSVERLGPDSRASLRGIDGGWTAAPPRSDDDARERFSSGIPSICPSSINIPALPTFANPHLPPHHTPPPNPPMDLISITSLLSSKKKPLDPTPPSILLSKYDIAVATLLAEAQSHITGPKLGATVDANLELAWRAQTHRLALIRLVYGSMSWEAVAGIVGVAGIHLWRGLTAQAREHAQRAQAVRRDVVARGVKQSPGAVGASFALYVCLGYCDACDGRYSDALKWVKKAQNIISRTPFSNESADAADIEVLRAEAAIRATKGDLDQAVVLYSKLIEKVQGFPVRNLDREILIFEELGALSLRLSRRDAALSHLAAAHALSAATRGPHSLTTLRLAFDLAEARLSGGEEDVVDAHVAELEQTVKRLEEGGASWGVLRRAMVLLSEAHLKSHNPADALPHTASLRRAATLHNDTATTQVAHILRARALARLERADEAIAWVEARVCGGEARGVERGDVRGQAERFLEDVGKSRGSAGVRAWLGSGEQKTRGG